MIGQRLDADRVGLVAERQQLVQGFGVAAQAEPRTRAK